MLTGSRSSDNAEAIEEISMKAIAEKKDPAALTALQDKTELFRKDIKNGASDSDLAERLFQYHQELCIQSGNKAIPLIFNAFHDVTIYMWESWICEYGRETALKTLEGFNRCLASGDGEGACDIYRKWSSDYVANNS